MQGGREAGQGRAGQGYTENGDSDSDSGRHRHRLLLTTSNRNSNINSNCDTCTGSSLGVRALNTRHPSLVTGYYTDAIINQNIARKEFIYYSNRTTDTYCTVQCIQYFS